jgi:hypothetical protein
VRLLVPIKVSGTETGTRRSPAIHSPITAHDGVRPRPSGLNQISRPHQMELWGPRQYSSSRWSVSFRSRGLLGLERADLAVSEPVVDEGEELSRDGHSGLELSSVLSYPEGDYPFTVGSSRGRLP